MTTADSIPLESSAEIEASWLAEAKRRLQAVREGRSTNVATEIVEDELDAIVARTRQDT